jgi:hypothetical protein
MEANLIRAAALYIPARTQILTAEKISAAALRHCEVHGLVLVAMAWLVTGAAGVISSGLAQVAMAARRDRDLERAVTAAGGRLVVLSPSRHRQRGPGLSDTLAAMIAAGRLTPDVAAELLAATRTEPRPSDPHRRPMRRSA